MCCLGLTSACGGNKIKVIPTPSESTVTLDDLPVGSGIVEIELPEKDNYYSIEVCSRPDYICYVTRPIKGLTRFILPNLF